MTSNLLKITKTNSPEFLMFNDLMEESRRIMLESFERDFMNPHSFELLCLIIAGYRLNHFDSDLIEGFVLLYGSSMNQLLKTIRIFFNIHNEPIPDSLYGVVKRMSCLLP